jgi:ADP-ribose pyrophosphatase YjhB (NUDIX family)
MTNYLNSQSQFTENTNILGECNSRRYYNDYTVENNKKNVMSKSLTPYNACSWNTSKTFVKNKNNKTIYSCKKNTETLNYCNNCGKKGHYFYQCKNPITSYGVIVYRLFKNSSGNYEKQYLMIRRRDSIGYVDFLRGKYSLFNSKYIKTLIMQMTKDEIQKIQKHSFDYLWKELWKDNVPISNVQNTTNLNNTIKNIKPVQLNSNNNFSVKNTPNTLTKLCENLFDGPFIGPQIINSDPLNMSIETTQLPYTKNTHYLQYSNQYDNEKYTCTKFNILQNEEPVFIKENKNAYTEYKISLHKIIEECNEYENVGWDEPEWGFCKGRRNYKESDYDCAVREMEEETGYSRLNMHYINNIKTFDEVFVGSNFKCYKHKYYLMYMNYDKSLETGNFEKSEVSCIKWCSYEECISLIRSYNVEKKQIITNIDNTLNKYLVM